MCIWMGLFSAGIRNNFLTLGNNIARGDIALRGRIEKAVTASIKKTLDNAEFGLREESEKIIKTIKGE